MSDEIQFAEPMPPADPAEYRFYHSMDLPGLGFQEGTWDLRGRFDEYVGGVDFRERTVLDVGTASGFLTFEAERRGGKVVSVDAADASLLDVLPFPIQDHSDQSPAEPDKNSELLRHRKLSYWVAHNAYASRARVFYGDARCLPEGLGQFDVVLVGQILVHLKDLITSVTSIAARCRSTLVISEGMLDEEQPISRFLGDEASPENNRAFWHHSTGLYRQLLGIIGFDLINRHAARYPCHALDEPGGPIITTLVFRRRTG